MDLMHLLGTNSAGQLHNASPLHPASPISPMRQVVRRSERNPTFRTVSCYKKVPFVGWGPSERLSERYADPTWSRAVMTND